jgi:hypothetical protein
LTVDKTLREQFNLAHVRDDDSAAADQVVVRVKEALC